MINFIKNIIRMIKTKKLIKKYDEVESLINQKKYIQAEKTLNDCIKISKKIENAKLYNLFKIYLLFLIQDYKNVVDIYPKTIESINNSKVDNEDTNKYYLGFVYLLVYISVIIENDEIKKELILKELSLLETNYKLIDEYKINRFPLYDNNKFLEYLKTHPFPEKLDEAKLEYLMVNLA